MPVAPLGGESITSSSFAFELVSSRVVKNMLLLGPFFYSGAFVPRVDFASVPRLTNFLAFQTKLCRDLVQMHVLLQH